MSMWTTTTQAQLFFSTYENGDFGACATVQANKRGLPIEMKATLERGAVISANVDR